MKKSSSKSAAKKTKVTKKTVKDLASKKTIKGGAVCNETCGGTSRVCTAGC